MIFHNSFCDIYRKPLGAVPEGTEVFLYIQTDEEFEKCTLRLWTHEDNEQLYPMEKTTMGFQIKIKLDKTGVCWYYFILTKDFQNTYYCCRNGYTGGKGTSSSTFEGSFQITVYDKNLKTPDWFKNSILYQIFPDRFNRRGINIRENSSRVIHHNWNDKPDYTLYGAPNNDFFGGNFIGIKDKLHYLKELGIDVIYLNPIFESHSNHRYDTSDYMKIDYMLGTEENFKELLNEGKDMGISFILDGVFNHTGSDSKYFNKYGRYEDIGAYQSKESPYYSWYKFDNYPDKYECWWEIDTLPNVNENNDSFRDFIYRKDDSVIAKWMKLGIKGWRLDVADELPNDFLEELYKRVKDIDKESVLIAEVWEDASNKVSYGKMRNYVQGKQFDSFMNYPLRNLIIDFVTFGHFEEGAFHNNIDAYTFSKKILNLYNNYPKEIFYSLMNFLSTHDTNRIMTLFQDWENEKALGKRAQSEYTPTKEQIDTGIRRIKMVWAFIIAFPGVPSLFYGDEIGLTGYKDPFNRCTYPWGNENMDMFYFFKKMNKIRKENNELSLGDFEFLFSREDTVAFERKYKNNSIIFAMNRNKFKPVSISIKSGHSFIDLESGEIFIPSANKILTVTINPISFRMLKKRI